jgi:hypothetical protein
MIASNRKAEMLGAVLCVERSLVCKSRQQCSWLAIRVFRMLAILAILFGFIGSRASVSEIVNGEVIETVEVVVSFHARHHEAESFSASDREFMRRRCVRHRGRNTNLVRCCCRCLNREICSDILSPGHRLPDNSLAPLLI